MVALFEGYPPWVGPVVAALVVLSVAALAAEMSARFVRRVVNALLGRLPHDAPTVVTMAPVSMVRWTVFGLTALVAVTPALTLAGVAVPGSPSLDGVTGWATTSGLRIVLIWLLATLVVRAARLAVGRFEAQVEGAAGVTTTEHGEHLRRAQTLGRLVHNAIRSLVFGIAALMVLRELNVDIMPILTGAGVVGLAVGFGAQTLVKDVIAGFFVILEDQIRVGDVATINGVGGMVEAITLRTIVLRDVTGAVHVFPNGSISTLANQTKDYSYYVIDLGVTFKEDPDRVMSVLERVGRALQEDPAFAPDMLEPLEILGVDAFGPLPQELVIKLRVKTRPTRQWLVGRELRRRIKLAFDEEGIEMPAAPRPVALRPNLEISEQRNPT
jgi:small conductance mechanosensitive channel